MYGSSPQVHKHFHDSHDWMLPNPPPKKNEQKAHGKGCSRSSFNNPKHKKSTSPQQGENSYAWSSSTAKSKEKTHLQSPAFKPALIVKGSEGGRSWVFWKMIGWSFKSSIQFLQLPCKGTHTLSQCAEYGYEDCSTHPGNSMIKNLPVFFEFVDLKLQPQEFVGSQSGLKGQ